MRQHIDPDRPVPSWIRDYYNAHTKSKEPRTLDSLLTCLTTHLKTSVSQVFILVDALDECNRDVQRQLLKFLLSLSSDVRMMIMSRPNQPADTSLWMLNAFDASQDDMEKYIQMRLEKSAYIAEILEETAHGQATLHLTRESLIKQVLSHANGM